MVLEVPLASVLYTLALISFAIAAYYGFRLSRLTRKTKVMVMVTKDGPTTLVMALVLLAASIVPYILSSEFGVNLSDAFEVMAGILLMSSAGMFASGFHKMYSVYLNERLKMGVNKVLDDLLEKEQVLGEEEFQGQYR